MAEAKKEIELEIAHVLFIDIVGLLEALSINDQYAAVEELNPVVRASEQFQRAEAADRLLKIATGDGMATGLLYQSGSHLKIKNECPALFFTYAISVTCGEASSSRPPAASGKL